MAELISGSHLPIPIGSLVGGIISQYLTVACFALIVYEYLVTLDEEVKHFWKGPFSISRALFFFNRYFPFLPIFVALLCQTLENPSDEL
ncbi:hypothetical protein D9613_004283 [Agrocybe pediades]|uniref:DUF6533 domain-containing protein n=1 Tax=Agrocybe pediades TaxID=84607 RepID=A0A8H4QJE5_9AGAR|nr:hypothetical protein D9613_004283 [Agrocybe pediades]